MPQGINRLSPPSLTLTERILAGRVGRGAHGDAGVARHKQALADGREDDYPDTWRLLFDAGGDAVAGFPPRRGSGENRLNKARPKD
jgi:hypothetical protein